MKEKIQVPLRRAGYVYILEDVERGMVKIGRSKKPSMRLSALRGSSGVPTGRAYVTYRVNDSGGLELKMHGLLVDYRVHGEWFRLGYEEALSVLLENLPDEFDDEAYSDAKLKDDIEGDERLHNLAVAMLPNYRRKENLAPEDLLALALEQLKPITAYLETQAMLYASLENDMPRFSKVSDGFIKILHHVKTSSQMMEQTREDLMEAHNSMTTKQRDLLLTILTRQLDELKSVN